ncbi:MAG: formate dehydrogenase subunit gamma [Desulfocapsaceae bacterium]|nr:formate dehydrogenase subunit gamma [Desulfocapsaceae bacterium]
MKKYWFVLITSLLAASIASAADSRIWGGMILANILAYGQEHATRLGPLFTTLQAFYFRKIFAGVLLCVPAAFLVHYLVLGQKVFSHDGEKIFVFSVFKRLVHWLAALAFIILIPTGLMMVFGRYLGGGTLVATARHLHGVGTVVFLVAVIPMFLFWVAEMLPTRDDMRWVLMAGGYLSRAKQEIPAGKFNAGQKMWFWMVTLGGSGMIATGAALYLQDFDYGAASLLGLSQIDLLRFCAIVHNFLAMAIIANFITHVYMALFAIKGVISSMITGYKEEEEVRFLHSSFYKKLKGQRQV